MTTQVPPEVSVIVPAWNAQDTIAEALHSALRQTHPPSEIIVVDDGSVDRTYEIVAAMAARHRPIRVVRQDNAGPSAARNRAIALSRCPVVAPLDADDVWHPQFLARCAAELVRTHAGFAYCWHHLIDERGATTRRPIEFDTAGAAFGPLALVNFVGNGSSAVFARSAIVEAGLYLPPVPGLHAGEDYLLQLRIAAKWPVACVPADLVAYRKSAASLSADPVSAYRTRLAAVEIACREAGAPPTPLLGWVAGDACRVRAVSLLRAGRIPAAVRWAFKAMIADPAGSVQDGIIRVHNMLGRRWSPPTGRHRIDLLTRRRMARLARLVQPLPPVEQRPQLAAFAERSSGQTLDPSGELGDEIAMASAVPA